MRNLFVTSLLFIILCSCSTPQEENLSVKNVMDDVITRLYGEVSPAAFDSVNTNFMLDFLTEKEKVVLATKYQYFKVNVPVTVSLMRHVEQSIVPFWLEESGFVKTDKKVKNVQYEYEVWQKDFDAGWVNLGIPGFDKDRVVYFISVGAQNKGDDLKITEQYPSEYSLEKMEKGAFTYHDWSDLKITELPEELEGQILFTTVRGRAREAHVEGAFRKTIFPSSAAPDQIILTWSEDPTNSVNLQWRTNTVVKEGTVKYWKQGSTDSLSTEATVKVMEDRMLYNDRYIHRHTAMLSQLEANTTYEYRVGSAVENSWSELRNFKTEAKDINAFSFIWFGDTHKDPKWAELLQDSYVRHPEIAFYSIAGDIVTTGLYRDQWDEFFGYAKDVFAYKPLMPVPGNHDRQDGLGAWMYYDLFSLPENGPEKVDKESTYAFEYGNALYVMIDATQPNEAQTEWIEKQLKNSKATWKFVMFHFPPYNFEEPYLDIQEEWGGIFDTYHVDMVMSGHIHYYMRTKPMNAGKVVNSFKEGTVYAVSIGTHGNHDDIGQEPYAVTRYKDGQFYQHMEIKDKVLKYTTYNKEGKIVDELLIDKN
ncbi:purple acid phosphatase family protein [Arcticibacterium luteifluviistationis]|uniref:Metallophosphoesterase n=1 Tax=Arcticibacterium luteifluviistationis TaxID=1784714 RepID=A0A2Z4G7H4_9BACT|nr:metallophosphoesterase family protein [Arcticibacterium luteifluviistationis]AWV97065.1 metallophosphoesterase [Arcticibacterium luteifluviistationis]